MADEVKPNEDANPNEEAKPKEEVKPEAQPTWGSKLKDAMAPILGSVLVLFYIGFLLSMQAHIKEEDLYWTRYIYLLSGVEAIAFAAAGYFFGSEVNRKAAENAKQDAEAAKDDAAAANERATDAEKVAIEAKTKGKALATATIVKARGQDSRSGAYGVLGGADAAHFSKSDFDELADLAKELFP